MSRVLGIGTTEFLALYADNSGTTLRSDAGGRCVFVTASGCRVHPRRPLVCRLYPLGRATDGTGEEKFAVFPKQIDCEAEFGTEGTVAGFLESQGVAPYIEWSGRYGLLYRRMMGLLERLGIEGKIESHATETASKVEDAAADPAPLSSWQDIDASLAEYCAAKGIAVPTEIDKAIALHLRAMEEWLDDLESRLADVRNNPKGDREP